MTESIGGRPFAPWTGRAVSVRRAGAPGGLPGMLRERGCGPATILIASPGCWSAPGLQAAAIVAGGFRIVLSSGFTDIARNSLINTGIIPVAIDPETLAKTQDAVESDSGILLTVDVATGEVRARGHLLARFRSDAEQWSRAMELADRSDSRVRGRDTLAGRLLLAQRLLRSALLSEGDRIRLQRRLVAICDAMKTPGADVARSARRLDRLLSELAGTGPDDGQRLPGPGPAPG